MQSLKRRGSLRLPLRIFWRNELPDKIHMYHPTIFRNHLQYIVGNATRVRIDGECIRVRKDHGSARDVQRVPHRVGAHVRNVRKHAEPVHFSHHAPPEFGQSVMLHAVRRRVGPVDIVPMRQGHVARAQFVKNTKRCREFSIMCPPSPPRRCARTCVCARYHLRSAPVQIPHGCGSSARPRQTRAAIHAERCASFACRNPHRPTSTVLPRILHTAAEYPRKESAEPCSYRASTNRRHWFPAASRANRCACL